MSDDKINFEIDIDTTTAEEKLKRLDELRRDAELEIEKSGKNSIKTIQKVISVAQATTTLVTSILNNVGIQTNALLDFAIQAVFSSISILTPILTAETMTPALAIQGIAGLVQLGIAGARVVELEQRRNELAYDTSGFEKSLNNLYILDDIVGYIGNLPF